METVSTIYNPNALIALRDLSSGTEQIVYAKATELEGMKEQIARLESINQSYFDAVFAVRDWALEQLDNGVDADMLQELADILKFEFSREYQVAVQIEYVFTVRAKDEDEVQNIIDNLDIPRMDVEASDESYVWGELIDHSYDEV